MLHRHSSLTGRNARIWNHQDTARTQDDTQESFRKPPTIPLARRAAGSTSAGSTVYRYMYIPQAFPTLSHNYKDVCRDGHLGCSSVYIPNSFGSLQFRLDCTLMRNENSRRSSTVSHMGSRSTQAGKMCLLLGLQNREHLTASASVPYFRLRGI